MFSPICARQWLFILYFSENPLSLISQTWGFQQCVSEDDPLDDFSVKIFYCILYIYEAFNLYVFEDAYLGHLSSKILRRNFHKHEAFNLYVFRDAYLRQFFSKKLYYKLHTRGFSPICFRR